jgi:hypothetical protein
MVRRGSTVRVRQRACMKCLQMALLCCLNLEHADTFRTHLRYARRIATSRDAFRHNSLAKHDRVDRQNPCKEATVVV